MAEAEGVYLCDVQAKTAFLLDLPVWVHDLFGLYGGEFLGYDLQWHHVDVSGLWRHTQFWKRLSHPISERIR